jgi:hypothetical protein
VSILAKLLNGLTFRRACAAATVALLCACSGSKGGTVATGSDALPSDSANRSIVITSHDLKRIVAWGPKGKTAVAQCPQGYKVVAGGSSSNDGSFVGTGYADSNRNAWIVKPDSNATAESFATCAMKGGVGTKFEWRFASPSNGLAGAQCHVGYTLVTGYSSGTVSDSWFNPDTSTFWVSGGGTAWASCVRNNAGVVIRHAWNKSQKPKAVYAGCGNGDTAIGGSMGNSAWPGPPIQEHPGVGASPGMQGYAGWWTFSNALNQLTWVACVAT